MEHIASAAVVQTCVMSTSQKTSHLLTLLIQHLTVSQMVVFLSFHGIKISGKEPSFCATVKCETCNLSVSQRGQTEQSFPLGSLSHSYSTLLHKEMLTGGLFVLATAE